MKTVIEKFLKAKHWQLFLLMFGAPFLFQIFLMVTAFANVGKDSDPMFMFNYFKLFPILMVIFMGTFFGWFWSIAVGLQNKIPNTVKMKLSKFKIFFFTPMVYMLLITIGLASLFSWLPEASKSGSEPDVALLGISFAVIVPLHLFSMFCLFYCLYFVAKTIKTVELQREATFSDFAGEFFLIWFYPVGVWIVQPKINKMAEV
jgi:hypothetical protein